MTSSVRQRLLAQLRSSYAKVHATLLPSSLPGPTNHPHFQELQHFIKQSLIIVGPYPSTVVQDENSTQVSVFSVADYTVRISAFISTEKSSRQSFPATSNNVGALAISSGAGFKPLLKEHFREHTIDEDLKDGWNFIEVKSGSSFRSFPILRPSIKGSEILFIESTDTLLAYGVDLVGDDFGNQVEDGYDIPTFYHRNPTFNFFRADPYPLQYTKPDLSKPYPRDHLITADHFLKRLVSRATGIDPDFAGDDYGDNFDKIRSYKMIVLGAHNEYWTDEKFSNLRRFVDEGGKLLILGGNTAWRRVVRSDSGTFIYGDGYFYLHGAHDLVGSKLGGGEDFGYVVTMPNHHVVKGVPKQFAHVVSVPTASGLATNGHETDRISSAKFDCLAKGPRDNGSHVVYRKLQEGGEVLKFGAVSLWLAHEDSGIESMVRNFFVGNGP